MSGGTGLFAAGKVVAWEESGATGRFRRRGRRAGDHPADASTTYSFRPQWKGNKPFPGGTIQAGAGPLPGRRAAATRLSVRIVPSSDSSVQAKVEQPVLQPEPGSDGLAWTDMDSHEAERAGTQGHLGDGRHHGERRLLHGECRLNEDLGINVDGTVVAWKESQASRARFPQRGLRDRDDDARGRHPDHQSQGKTNKPEGSARIYAALVLAVGQLKGSPRPHSRSRCSARPPRAPAQVSNQPET